MLRTLGIVIAGGAGRRLGPGPIKALRVVAGRTLLARAIAALEAVCDDVVVAAPEGLELPVAAGRRAHDPPGTAGPIAGLIAGLAARSHAHALVLGVDFPLARPAALAALGGMLEGGAAAVVPEPGGFPQPLFAAYGTGARDALAARLEAGEGSVTAAVRSLDPLRLDDKALDRLPGGRDNFLNVNTPDDLIEAERRLRDIERAAGGRA